MKKMLRRYISVLFSIIMLAVTFPSALAIAHFEKAIDATYGADEPEQGNSANIHGATAAVAASDLILYEFYPVFAENFDYIYSDGDALDLSGLRVFAIYYDLNDENFFDNPIEVEIMDYTVSPPLGTVMYCGAGDVEAMYPIRIEYEEFDPVFGPSRHVFSFFITVLPGVVKDYDFLQERAAEILKKGLGHNELRLAGRVLTLAIEDREFVLSTNANNRNISGKIPLGDGYCLRFDLKGNGSNIKAFSVYKEE